MEQPVFYCQMLAEAEETVDDLNTYSPALWAPVMLSTDKHTAADVWRRFSRGNKRANPLEVLPPSVHFLAFFFLILIDAKMYVCFNFSTLKHLHSEECCTHILTST